jgi:hypothetical protein
VLEIAHWRSLPIAPSRARRAAHLLEEDERDRAEAFRVHGVVREVIANIEILLPRITIETEIPSGVRLPPATFAEWHAILQNVMTNVRLKSADHLKAD